MCCDVIVGCTLIEFFVRESLRWRMQKSGGIFENGLALFSIFKFVSKKLVKNLKFTIFKFQLKKKISRKAPLLMSPPPFTDTVNSNNKLLCVEDRLLVRLRALAMFTAYSPRLGGITCLKFWFWFGWCCRLTFPELSSYFGDFACFFFSFAGRAGKWDG